MDDSKFAEFPGKFKTHLLGPYIIKHIFDGGTIDLAKLNAQLILGRVNGSILKVYRDDFVPRASH